MRFLLHSCHITPQKCIQPNIQGVQKLGNPPLPTGCPETRQSPLPTGCPETRQSPSHRFHRLFFHLITPAKYLFTKERIIGFVMRTVKATSTFPMILRPATRVQQYDFRVTKRCSVHCFQLLQSNSVLGWSSVGCRNSCETRRHGPDHNRRRISSFSLIAFSLQRNNIFSHHRFIPPTNV